MGYSHVAHTDSWEWTLAHSLTFAALFLGFGGFEVNGGQGAHQLHGLCLNQHRVLLLPARPLQVQASDVHPILKDNCCHIFWTCKMSAHSSFFSQPAPCSYKPWMYTPSWKTITVRYSEHSKLFSWNYFSFLNASSSLFPLKSKCSTSINFWPVQVLILPSANKKYSSLCYLKLIWSSSFDLHGVKSSQFTWPSDSHI